MNLRQMFKTWIEVLTKRQLRRQLETLQLDACVLQRQVEDLHEWLAHVQGRKEALDQRIATATAAIEVLTDLLCVDEDSLSRMEDREAFLRQRIEAAQVAAHRVERALRPTANLDEVEP